jgi:hypothetical protein
MLTRNELANRWKVTPRTIDRLRRLGLLPWQDLRKGTAARPIVRFQIEDIQEYEAASPRRRG